MIFLNGNILRIQPPLVIKKEEMLKALEIIDSAIDDYLSGRISDDTLKLIKGWA
jgi:4-aminobutyrate aminotransferase